MDKYLRLNVSELVTGAALRVAAVISELPDREPREVIWDEIQCSQLTPQQRNAHAVRTVLVSTLKAQYNLWINQDVIDDAVQEAHMERAARDAVGKRLPSTQASA